MPYVPGPFLTDHIYLQWGGKLPGNEEWSCGLRMAPVQNVADWPGLAVTMAGSGLVQQAISNFHAAANTYISNTAKLDYIKVNAIGTNGKYLAATTNEIVVSPEIVGYAQPRYPNQVALAISLTTGVTRGPAHRGRFFLPLPGVASGADGLIATDDRDSVKSGALNLIDALNAVSASVKVSVMSRKNGAPASRVVTGVEVGRVLDTQRRRRRSLPESY